MDKQQLDILADPEFSSPADLYAYFDAMRALGHLGNSLFDAAAEQAYRILVYAAQHPVHKEGRVQPRPMSPLTAKSAARKVSRQLDGAGQDMHDILRRGFTAEKLFKRYFADILDPPAQRQASSFNWGQQ